LNCDDGIGRIIVVRANLRGDRCEERGDEDQDKHNEGPVGPVRRSALRRFVNVIVGHKLSRPPRIAGRNLEESEV
jgi:hypothetical protein